MFGDWPVIMLMTCVLGCGACAMGEPLSEPPKVDTVQAQADLLEKRWAEQYLKPNDSNEIERLNAAARSSLALINEQGRFKDLTYGPMITGRNGGQGWGDHLLRTVDLFTAWRTPGTTLYRDKALATQAGAALDAYLAAPWDKNDPWGYGHPYADLLENNRIGRCCLFARSDPSTFAQARIEAWANHITTRSLHPIFEASEDPAQQFTKVRPLWEGGANVLWAVRGDLVPYLVSSDSELRIRAIDRYMSHVWKSQLVRSPKGPLGQIERLTVDGMLGEHSAPAMGSYGEWYLNAIIEYRDLVQGIPRWQMPLELSAHWIDVLLDSVAYCYQGAIDPHLGNPLIWLNARRNGNAKLKEWLVAFSSSSNHRADEVTRMLAWEPGVTPWPNPDRSLRYYYTTDYMTKHYPHYMASVRAVSERTFGMETFGQTEHRWALESVLLPLGTTLLRRDTAEFQDLDTGGVFTALDYARLPGQTTRHVSPAALSATWNRDASGFAVRMVFGSTPFAGGVESPHVGFMSWWQSRLITVDRDRHNEQKLSDLSVNGRRSVFFLADAIVHLGAGFDVRHESEATLTNLEQCASGNGPIAYSNGTEVRSLSHGQAIRDHDIDWAWRDRVGYIPPADGEKVIQDILQAGTPEKNVFSFWSDHGKSNRNLSFEWAVLPDVSVDEMPDKVKHKSWVVLENTTNLQAIAVPSKNWVGVAFHAPGRLVALGTEIEVDRPSLLMIEQRGNELIVYAADPFQTDSQLKIRVGDREIPVRFPGYPHCGKTVKIAIALR